MTNNFYDYIVSELKKQKQCLYDNEDTSYKGQSIRMNEFHIDSYTEQELKPLALLLR